MARKTSRREQGSALFVAVMMLVLMGALGIAALDTVTRDQQVAGFQNQSTSAFYAAEAAAAEARSLIRNVGSRAETPTFYASTAPASLGDSTTYQMGTPTYYGDPAVAPDPPIRWVKDGTIYGQGGNMRQGRQQFVKSLWQINVVGQTVGGARSRVEIVETKLLSRGY